MRDAEVTRMAEGLIDSRKADLSLFEGEFSRGQRSALEQMKRAIAGANDFAVDEVMGLAARDVAAEEQRSRMKKAGFKFILGFLKLSPLVDVVSPGGGGGGSGGISAQARGQVEQVIGPIDKAQAEVQTFIDEVNDDERGSPEELAALTDESVERQIDVFTEQHVQSLRAEFNGTIGSEAHVKQLISEAQDELEITFSDTDSAVDRDDKKARIETKVSEILKGQWQQLEEKYKGQTERFQQRADIMNGKGKGLLDRYFQRLRLIQYAETQGEKGKLSKALGHRLSQFFPDKVIQRKYMLMAMMKRMPKRAEFRGKVGTTADEYRAAKKGADHQLPSVRTPKKKLREAVVRSVGDEWNDLHHHLVDDLNSLQAGGDIIHDEDSRYIPTRDNPKPKKEQKKGAAPPPRSSLQHRKTLAIGELLTDIMADPSAQGLADTEEEKAELEVEIGALLAEMLELDPEIEEISKFDIDGVLDRALEVARQAGMKPSADPTEAQVKEAWKSPPVVHDDERPDSPDERDLASPTSLRSSTSSHIHLPRSTDTQDRREEQQEKLRAQLEAIRGLGGNQAERVDEHQQTERGDALRQAARVRRISTTFGGSEHDLESITDVVHAADTSPDINELVKQIESLSSGKLDEFTTLFQQATQQLAKLRDDAPPSRNTSFGSEGEWGDDIGPPGEEDDRYISPSTKPS